MKITEIYPLNKKLPKLRSFFIQICKTITCPAINVTFSVTRVFGNFAVIGDNQLLILYPCTTDIFQRFDVRLTIFSLMVTFKALSELQ